MSKTTPPKKPAKPTTAKRAATSDKNPAPTQTKPKKTDVGSKVGAGLQKKPRSDQAGTKTGSRSVPLGSAAKKRAAPAKKAAPASKRTPPGSASIPALDPAGFRRASVTLSVALEGAQQAHEGQQQASAPAGSTTSASAAQPGQDTAPASAAPMREPTELERRFAFEYVQDGNATRAYMRARGGSTRTTTASTEGTRMLGKPWVGALVEAERLKLQERIGFTNEDLLRRITMMILADARELSEHVIESCRYCHGDDHGYHRTRVEYERDLREFLTHGRQRIGGVYINPRSRKGRLNSPPSREDDEPQFEEQGGPGFDPHREPHPDCPQCHGYGVGRTIWKDTRLLSPGAAMLYAGVEETKDGFKIRQHDQVALMEKLAKHLGLYDADNRQRSSNPLADLIAAIGGPKSALPITENPDD